ncbi:ABC1 kinase family protein [Leucobacter japonicus]|uniref:ABC1 kinase family protein n=1 Tax=Leucobacter japonicus TaxID=1461259 RepID=UPI0006A7B388|nr:AarF/UbiB family protein [Leucobacter japonicus]
MSVERPLESRSGSAAVSEIDRARYRRILRFASRHLVVAWWFELVLPRFGLGFIAERTRSRRMQRFARSFHGFAIELRGLMIKVGQFMSSRLDVLPPEVTAELEGLQDEVPAESFADITRLAEHELGVSLGSVFTEIDPAPVAAASLGQAHRAVLSGALAADAGFERAVLKVQRPGIDGVVAVDLAALRRVGRWLSHVRLVSRRVDMPALVEEFAATSLEEIDYVHEAANAERFREYFADDPGVGVPEIVWERSSTRVLTLEDVTAIKITDVDALRAAGIDPHEVALRFARVMFDQLFTHGFFHADPHPGNVFVTPTDGDWRLTFIDFGMMGEVPSGTRSALRSLLVAAASRDGRGLVNAMQEVGVLLPSADTAELERAMTQLFARFGGMGFAELRDVDPREFRDFGRQFSDVIRTLPFQLPENFLLIVRAISLTSGVCSALDPRFNLWDAVEPYAQQLIREERGNLVRDFAGRALRTMQAAARAPGRLDAILSRIDDDDLEVRLPRLERRLQRLETAQRRIIAAVTGTGLLIAGAVVVSAVPVLGTVLMIAAAVPFIAVLVGFLRR